MRMLVAILLGWTLSVAGQERNILGPGDRQRVLTGWPGRPYVLHIPPGYVPSKPAPVILAIHGGGGNSEAAARLTSPNGKQDNPKCLNKLADRENFIVIYPNGTGNPILPSVRTWNAGGGKKGYEGISGDAVDKNINDIAYFTALLDDLETVVTLDRSRIFATGISNGGAMCYRLACNLSERIAAIAPIASGDQFSAAEDWPAVSSPVSVIHIHGTADRAWPFEGGQGTPVFTRRERKGMVVSVKETISHWVSRNGCSPTPRVENLPDAADDSTTVTRETYTGGRGGAEVVLYKIQGAGHTWPQGYPYLPERRIGKICQDINANEAIWEFFKRHPKAIESKTDKK